MRTILWAAALAFVLVGATGPSALAQSGTHPDSGGTTAHSTKRMDRMAGSAGGGTSYASSMNPKDGSTGTPGTPPIAGKKAAALGGWPGGHPLGR